MVGTLIGGDLEITECLARGGTSAVYKAVEPSSGHRVAVKILNVPSSSDDRAYRCFRAEVLSLARVTHPHAVRLYDWGRTDDDRWYIVMEFLEGRSMDSVLRTGPLDIDRGLSILDDVAAVLEQAHGLGIIHRDIKPANIILQSVGGDEFVRVLDFGVAHLVHQPDGADVPSGTPAYMAPEQIRGAQIDGRADIYALGVVAYEVFGGRVPFDDPTPTTVLARQISEVPPLLQDPELGLPPDLSELIGQMLEKEPDDRPASISEVRRRLRALRQSRPTLIGLAPSDALDPAEAAWFDRESDEPSRRTRLIAWAAFIALLLALAALVWPGRQAPTIETTRALELPPEVNVPPPPIVATPTAAVTGTLITRPAMTASAASTPSAPSRMGRSTASPTSRTIKVCYEVVGTKTVMAPRLLVDGRPVAAAPASRCFRARVRYGVHRFTLVADPDVHLTLRRKVTDGTAGIFFLVE